MIRTLTLIALGLGLLTPLGCDGRDGNTLIVGSKKFTEQRLLGEMLAQLVEDRTELTVERQFNLGGTMICHQALVDGDIDVYPEYTGTALVTILDRAVIREPDAAYDVVAEAYDEQFDCIWLEPIGFNNTYAIAVREDDAAERRWSTISDVKGAAGELSAGFTHEFLGRDDGYPGLKRKYDLSFEATRAMAPALMYKAIADGDVDVISAFATDGRIAAYDLQILDDDAGFFPPYFAAPVVRQAALEAHPELRKALGALAGRIDDATMQRLNFEVDEKKRDVADVARDFLTAQGLIGADATE